MRRSEFIERMVIELRAMLCQGTHEEDHAEPYYNYKNAYAEAATQARHMESQGHVFDNTKEDDAGLVNWHGLPLLFECENYGPARDAIKDPTFPKPIMGKSQKSWVWRKRDIIEWVQNKGVSR